MFSGIVEETAQVVAIEHDKDNIHITMKCSFVDELKIDQSVAHNGVCLTVVRKDRDTFTTTAMRETLERSNLGLLKPGSLVNLERSMMMNGRLDGHIVQGHVDQTAVCTSVEAAIFLYENEDGSFKASMRSSGKVDVAVIMMSYGGGGHIRAAGATIEGNAKEILEGIVKDVEKQLLK